MSRNSYVIGIAGGSGSGKTSFVKALRASFTKEEVCFISLDDYYRPREVQLTDSQGIKNFDLPEAIDATKLVMELDALLAGKIVDKEKYTFNNEKAEKTLFRLIPAKIIIVEGLYVYHYEEVKQRLDLKLFVEANDELKLIRRIKRDKEERNYPLEDVIYRYEHHVMPSYRKHIGIYKKDVDLIINNNVSFDKSLDVIKSYISAKLVD